MCSKQWYTSSPANVLPNDIIKEANATPISFTITDSRIAWKFTSKGE